MFEERLTFDYNSKTEQIFTTISDKLRQGFKISLLFTPSVSHSKSPSTNLQSQLEPLQQSHISHISQGPILKMEQVQSKPVELEPVPEADAETKKQSQLEKKFEVAMEHYHKEQYSHVLIQFTTIEMQIEYMIKNQKLTYHKRKRLLVLSIQMKYYASQVYKHQGKVPQAIERLEQCVKMYVINDQDTLMKITLELALLYMGSMRFNKALEIFNRLLIQYEQLNWKAEQAHVLSYIGLIFALYQMNDEAKRIGSEALDICKSVLSKSDIRVNECYYFLGYIYFLNKDYDFALEFLEHAIPVHNTENLTIKVLNLLAMVQQVKGLHAQAVKTFEKALQLSHHKHKSQLYNNLGLVFMEQGMLGKAKKAFEKATELHLQQHHGEYVEQKQRAKKNLNFLLTNVHAL